MLLYFKIHPSEHLCKVLAALESATEVLYGSQKEITICLI